MNNQLDEQLSALVDSECRPEETALLVKRLLNNDALKAKWARYQLISDVLRHQLPDQLPTNFTQSVMAHVVLEPTPKVPRQPRQLATAAALLLAGGLLLTGGLYQMRSSDTAAQNQDARQTAQLQNYLVTHAGYTSHHPMNDMRSFVRVVGYSADKQ